MRQHFLNVLYSQYASGIIERSELEGLIFNFLLKNQGKTPFGHWKHEEYEDFLSWFYPRLRKIVNSYTETTTPFDSYISSMMRLPAKEYRMMTVSRSVTEYSAWSVQVPELYAREEPPVYSYETRESEISRLISHNGRIKNKKQLLALILKCYYYVSEDFLDRISGSLELDKNELKEMIDKMRALRQKKDDELYRMKERIYCQYYRCIVYEKKLSYITENSIISMKLKRRLEKARKRLESMRKRMACIRTDATNKEIADVIGISKGSVDSTLYNLKTKWKNMADKSMLN
jgi:hypothetical protein